MCVRVSGYGNAQFRFERQQTNIHTHTNNKKTLSYPAACAVLMKCETILIATRVGRVSACALSRRNIQICVQVSRMQRLGATRVCATFHSTVYARTHLCILCMHVYKYSQINAYTCLRCIILLCTSYINIYIYMHICVYCSTRAAIRPHTHTQTQTRGPLKSRGTARRMRMARARLSDTPECQKATINSNT